MGINDKRTSMNSMPGSPRCLFCGKAARFFFEKKSSRGDFPVFRCDSCRGAFVWPRPSPDESLRLYKVESYSDLSLERSDELDLGYFPNSRMDARRIITRCLALAPGRSFFDIGAGHGTYTFAAQEAGFDVVACEPSPKARAIFAARLGFEPDPGAFDDLMADRLKNRFNVALLSQTLEHVPDPEGMARNLNSVLRPAGIAAIAVPHLGSALSILQGHNDMFISPPEHLNFFSRAGLIGLLNGAGFQLEHIETVSKIPRHYVQKILRHPVLTQIGWKTGYRLMRFFDALGLGMVINAFFRKL